MRIVTVEMSEDEALAMFPAHGEEGKDVRPNELAELVARNALDRSTLNTPFAWHAPNTFDVRYGSNYVASATFGDMRVRFLCSQFEGTWREGDDVGVDAN